MNNCSTYKHRKGGWGYIKKNTRKTGGRKRRYKYKKIVKHTKYIENIQKKIDLENIKVVLHSVVVL